MPIMAITVTLHTTDTDTEDTTVDTTDTDIPDTDTPDTGARGTLKPTLLPNPRLRLMPNPMLMLGGIMAVTTVTAVPTTVDTTTVDTTVMADGGKCYFSISQDPNTLLSFRKRRQQHPNSIFATNFISPKIFFLNWK